jgi:hypothetical protein
MKTLLQLCPRLLALLPEVLDLVASWNGLLSISLKETKRMPWIH